MVRQYVGARYVPKFASPVEWAADTSYEALTIVTFNNASYTSKIQVPPTVGNPANNPKYWALTGNYNAQVEQYRQETVGYKTEVEGYRQDAENYKTQVKGYKQETEQYKTQVDEYKQETENIKSAISTIVSDAVNADISDKLNTALQHGNVELTGGPYYISKQITVPKNTTLNGNGTVLTAKTSITGKYVIIIGNESSATEVPFYKTALYNLTINCNHLTYGVNILERGVYVDNVKIVDPKQNEGIGIAIREGYASLSNYPSDCNITNCDVYEQNIGENHFNCGLYINATDNMVTNFRTLGSKIGVYISEKGGGCYLTNCHPLAFDSNNDDWDNSAAFEVHAHTILNDCYSDNFKYGIYTPTGAEVDGANFYSQYYEKHKTADRCAVYNKTDNFNLHLRDIRQYPRTPAVLSDTKVKFENIVNSKFNVLTPRPDDIYWHKNDIGLDIARHGGKYFIYAGHNASIPVVFIQPDTVAQYSPTTVNIYGDEFAIIDLIVKQTGGSASVSSWGTLKLFRGVSSGSITLTLKHDSDNYAWIEISSISNMNFWNLSVTSKTGIAWLPSQPITLTGGTTDYSNTYTV